jgi:hypothetical protein
MDHAAYFRDLADDDGRPIEVVDTLFTEDPLRELLSRKTRGLHITLKPWWWWASYTVV